MTVEEKRNNKGFLEVTARRQNVCLIHSRYHNNKKSQKKVPNCRKKTVFLEEPEEHFNQSSYTNRPGKGGILLGIYEEEIFVQELRPEEVTWQKKNILIV